VFRAAEIVIETKNLHARLSAFLSSTKGRRRPFRDAWGRWDATEYGLRVPGKAIAGGSGVKRCAAPLSWKKRHSTVSTAIERKNPLLSFSANFYPRTRPPVRLREMAVVVRLTTQLHWVSWDHGYCDYLASICLNQLAPVGVTGAGWRTYFPADLKTRPNSIGVQDSSGKGFFSKLRESKRSGS